MSKKGNVDIDTAIKVFKGFKDSYDKEYKNCGCQCDGYEGCREVRAGCLYHVELNSKLVDWLQEYKYLKQPNCDKEKNITEF